MSTTKHVPQAIFANLVNLQDKNRTRTKIRFAETTEKARVGEIKLLPAAIFLGKETTMRYSGHTEVPVITVMYSVTDRCIKALEEAPVVQEDGYYHLTQSQLVFMAIGFVNEAAVDSKYYNAIQHITRQVDDVSVVVDLENSITFAPKAVMYITFSVSDEDLKTAVEKSSGVFTTFAIEGSDLVKNA